MKKTFTKKKSAFSLIELSIVLIIIGLLIAGVTGGASLIKSSELRSVMGEARGYSVAVNAFYTQFDGLPGDFSTAVGEVTVNGTAIATPTGGLGVGDGDDKIEFCTTGCTSNATDSTGSEGAIAWHHLASAGALETVPDFTGGATAAKNVGTHYPASKIKSAGWGFDYNTTSLQNVVVLTGSTTVAATVDTNSLVNGTPIATGVLLPTDALSIDSKIDDGSPITGKIRSVTTTNCLNTTPDPDVYDVAYTDSKSCAISYQVDVNT